MDDPGDQSGATGGMNSLADRPAAAAPPHSDRHRHLIGEKREVPADEWERIRRAYFSDHRDIRAIAKEFGLRRSVVRAVICPWD